MKGNRKSASHKMMDDAEAEKIMASFFYQVTRHNMELSLAILGIMGGALIGHYEGGWIPVWAVGGGMLGSILGAIFELRDVMRPVINKNDLQKMRKYAENPVVSAWLEEGLRAGNVIRDRDLIAAELEVNGCKFSSAKAKAAQNELRLSILGVPAEKSDGENADA